MQPTPDWLRQILAAAPSPREAAEHLLFHGTLEPFEGRLTASSWEGLRWTAEDPCVAQSYCPETGGLTGWFAPMAYEMDSRLLPNGPINSIILRELGVDEMEMDIKRDHTDRVTSYRILDNHPTNRQACEFLAGLGYDPSQTCCWVKTRKEGNCEQILPASYKAPGRLFILERPADLRILNYASSCDGGLTGRQWMHTDVFKSAAASGEWDGIEIDDIHQSKQLGHFGHRSIGLFGPTLARLRYHVIDIVHFDPWDCWKTKDLTATTPEFDALWASCRELQLAA